MNEKLTREQAVAIAGATAVEAVDRTNCEPTNRVGYLGSCHGNEMIEWSAAAAATDSDGDEITVRAYYYTDRDDEAVANEHGWDMVDFVVSHYEVI